MLATHVKAKPPTVPAPAPAPEPEPEEDPRDSENDWTSEDSEETAAASSSDDAPAYSTMSRYSGTSKPLQHRELLAKRPNEVARLDALARISRAWGAGVERVLDNSMQPKEAVTKKVRAAPGEKEKIVTHWVEKPPQNWPRRMLVNLAKVARLQIAAGDVNRMLAAKVNARLNRTGKWGPRFQTVQAEEVVALFDELVKGGVQCKPETGFGYAAASGGMEAVMEESQAE